LSAIRRSFAAVFGGLHESNECFVSRVVVNLNISGKSAELGPTGRSVAINITKATTTQLVAPSGSTQIYVTAWDVFANSASGVTLEYGTNTTNPCDTGTTALSAAYSFAAQAGMSVSGGPQPLYVIPQGNAVCAVTSGAGVSLAGSLSYTQY
jgi:hypothetical protein